MKLLNGSLNSTPLLVLIIVSLLKLSSPHNKNSIKNSLVKYFSENSVFHFCYPFGTFNGLDKLLTNCINPLLDSIPDLERRDMIVMAGTTPEGKDWLAKYAIYNF